MSENEENSESLSNSASKTNKKRKRINEDEDIGLEDFFKRKEYLVEKIQLNVLYDKKASGQSGKRNFTDKSKSKKYKKGEVDVVEEAEEKKEEDEKKSEKKTIRFETWKRNPKEKNNLQKILEKINEIEMMEERNEVKKQEILKLQKSDTLSEFIYSNSRTYDTLRAEIELEDYTNEEQNVILSSENYCLNVADLVNWLKKKPIQANPKKIDDVDENYFAENNLENVLLECERDAFQNIVSSGGFSENDKTIKAVRETLKHKFKWDNKYRAESYFNKADVLRKLYGHNIPDYRQKIIDLEAEVEILKKKVKESNDKHDYLILAAELSLGDGEMSLL